MRRSRNPKALKSYTPEGKNYKTITIATSAAYTAGLRFERSEPPARRPKMRGTISVCLIALGVASIGSVPADARSVRDSCGKQAADRNLHGAAKTSFTTKCEKDAMVRPSDNVTHDVVDPLNCPPNADALRSAGVGCTRLH
jgi:hypothetical protein